MSSLRAARTPMFLAAATLVAAGLGTASLGSDAAEAAVDTTYYVSPDGSDDNSGTSPGAAWKTLGRVTAASLDPGDTVLLRRSATFDGQLRITESGDQGKRITVDAYGTGSLPRITGDCVRIEGSWVTVRHVHTTDCDWAGIAIKGNRVRVEFSQTTHNVTGIHVGSGSDHAVVARNEVINNDRMSVNTPGGDDDSGAFGILVNGDHSRIARNRIFGHHAESFDYGADGAAVEIYGAVGTRVHHNVAGHNHTFTELGDSRTRDTVFAYNVSSSSLPNADFLVTRGAESGWGPVLNTRVVHNTVVETGPGSQGFVCHAGCNRDILTLRGNIISAAGKVGYADGPMAGGRNVFWGGLTQFAMLAGDKTTQPDFVDVKAGDLRLKSGSPAIDLLRRPGWKRDVTGSPSFMDGDGDGEARADAGAYEK